MVWRGLGSCLLRSPNPSNTPLFPTPLNGPGVPAARLRPDLGPVTKKQDWRDVVDHGLSIRVLGRLVTPEDSVTSVSVAEAFVGRPALGLPEFRKCSRDRVRSVTASDGPTPVL